MGGERSCIRLWDSTGNWNDNIELIPKEDISLYNKKFTQEDVMVDFIMLNDVPNMVIGEENLIVLSTPTME